MSVEISIVISYRDRSKNITKTFVKTERVVFIHNINFNAEVLLILNLIHLGK